jgi:RNA-binding protein
MDAPVKQSLSGRAARHLRALGHALDPVVALGKNGITPALVKQTSAALLQHELVTVRIQPEAPLDRHEAADALADETSSAIAQVLGRTILLYKKHPKEPKIVLPASAKADAAK